VKFNFCNGSYTGLSNVLGDEECINWYVETNETAGAQSPKSLIRTPGLAIESTLADGPVRGQCWTGARRFAVGGDTLYEIAEDGTQTVRATIESDGSPVSIAFSTIQLLIVSFGHAYCYTLADNTIVDVTADLAGVPVKVKYADGYFIVCFYLSNKFQISDILDGTVWPGIQVNEVSVFAENITSIEVSHRELWVFGSQHAQPYQNTGTDEIYDVIPGTLIETGNLALFGTTLLDNTIFFVHEDERGGRVAARMNGYTPQRISTHAVEYDLRTYDDLSGLVTYSYQDCGHLFWVLYIPGSSFSWVFDVAESLWHKRAIWHVDTAIFTVHPTWNHIYAYGKHLVGDPLSGNIYAMSLDYLDDYGNVTRRVRQTPTIGNEMEWVRLSSLTVDLNVGITPQPPFTDGDGNPRPAQAMLEWSDNHGNTWSNQHIVSCGFAGEYNTRVKWWRLGQTRYRVFRFSVTDPVPWVVLDSYLKVSA
jgi:hypothetical protein